MRGPLRSLWGRRLPGAYLRYQLAFLVAGLLAAASVAFVVSVGGLAGILALSLISFLALVAFCAVLSLR